MGGSERCSITFSRRIRTPTMLSVGCGATPNWALQGTAKSTAPLSSTVERWIIDATTGNDREDTDALFLERGRTCHEENEENHDNKNTCVLERSVVLFARVRKWSGSTPAGRRAGCTESHHLCLGRTSSGRRNSGEHAELLRPCPVRGRFRRSPRGISNFHHDELRVHCDWNVPGDSWVLRQRGVRAECAGKEREGRRYRFFCSGVHRGLRR